MNDWSDLFLQRYQAAREVRKLGDEQRWDDLDRLFTAAPGDYSAYVCNLRGAVHYAYRSDVVHPAASLVKVPLALTVNDYARQGLLDLDQTVELTDAVRVEGEGTVDRAPAGMRWSYAALLYHMLHESDNTAGNLLIDRLDQIAAPGMDLVNRWAETHGARSTRLRRRFMDFVAAQSGRENLTTAADMCRVLRELIPDKIPALPTNPAYSPFRLLEHLINSAGQEKLVAGLPPGTHVAHKVGDLPGVEHDAGLVVTPKGLYIVALLASSLPDAVTGQRTLAAASRLIYERMCGGSHGS